MLESMASSAQRTTSCFCLESGTSGVAFHPKLTWFLLKVVALVFARAVESGFRGRSLCSLPSGEPCFKHWESALFSGFSGFSAALSHSRRSIRETQHSPFCHLAGGPRQPCRVTNFGVESDAVLLAQSA